MSKAGETSSRTVLRRVHRNHYSPTVPITVLPLAFRPNRHDIDGISVFLTEEHGGISPKACATMGDRDAADFIVVALHESDLLALGMTLELDSDPHAPRGHAFIPEINCVDYAQGGELKRTLKARTARLAELATRSIVFSN